MKMIIPFMIIMRMPNWVAGLSRDCRRNVMWSGSRFIRAVRAILGGFTLIRFALTQQPRRWPSVKALAKSRAQSRGKI
jgi:hypothetical protein